MTPPAPSRTAPAWPPSQIAALPLLVSVRDAEEADAALRGGADWIDLKEPRRGPLGAVDASVAREAARRVHRPVPLSAAAGELRDWPHGAARELLNVDGVLLLKLGLSGCRGVDWQARWRMAHRQITTAGRELAAVIYADARLASAPEPDEVVELATQVGCRWLLIDTFDKSAGSVADHLDATALRKVLQAARAASMATVVAGSLNATVIARLPLQRIDMLAVRSAVCDGDRHGTISAQRVAAVQALVSSLVRESSLTRFVFSQR